jgi:pyochelin biosynthesis protein PchC
MASVRLVCFPHAGAGASSYRLWPSLLPRSVEVLAAQLPGREDRLREAPLRDWEELVAATVAGLRPHVALPFALFGHSMGAALALDVARTLEASGGPPPRHVFVAGRPGPGQVFWHGPLLATLGDDGAFLAALRQRYGSGGDGLEDPEIRDVVLPGLRADVAALESRPDTMGAPLGCPITAYGGAADPSTTVEGLAAWRQATSRGLQVHVLPGGHFFLDESRGALVADVRETLAALDPAGSR